MKDPSPPLIPPTPGGSQAKHPRLQFCILPLDGSIGEQESRSRGPRAEGAGQGPLGSGPQATPSSVP